MDGRCLEPARGPRRTALRSRKGRTHAAHARLLRRRRRTRAASDDEAVVHQPQQPQRPRGGADGDKLQDQRALSLRQIHSTVGAPPHHRRGAGRARAGAGRRCSQTAPACPRSRHPRRRQRRSAIIGRAQLSRGPQTVGGAVSGDADASGARQRRPALALSQPEAAPGALASIHGGHQSDAGRRVGEAVLASAPADVLRAGAHPPRHRRADRPSRGRRHRRHDDPEGGSGGARHAGAFRRLVVIDDCRQVRPAGLGAASEERQHDLDAREQGEAVRRPRDHRIAFVGRPRASRADETRCRVQDRDLALSDEAGQRQACQLDARRAGLQQRHRHRRRQRVAALRLSVIVRRHAVQRGLQGHQSLPEVAGRVGEGQGRDLRDVAVCTGEGGVDGEARRSAVELRSGKARLGAGDRRRRHQGRLHLRTTPVRERRQGALERALSVAGRAKVARRTDCRRAATVDRSGP